jgi:hypothetical protein
MSGIAGDKNKFLENQLLDLFPLNLGRLGRLLLTGWQRLKQAHDYC